MPSSSERPSVSTPRRPGASTSTIPADDLWLGWFDAPSRPTIDVFPEAEPQETGLLDAQGRPLVRLPQRIGFLPWLLQTADTSGSDTS